MEWDNHDLLTSMQYDEKNKTGNSPVAEKKLSSTQLQSLLPLSNSDKYLDVKSFDPDWCSQESGYLESVGTPASDVMTTSFTSASILSPLQEKRYEKRKDKPSS